MTAAEILLPVIPTARACWFDPYITACVLSSLIALDEMDDSRIPARLSHTGSLANSVMGCATLPRRNERPLLGDDEEDEEDDDEEDDISFLWYSGNEADARMCVWSLLSGIDCASFNTQRYYFSRQRLHWFRQVSERMQTPSRLCRMYSAINHLMHVSHFIFQ